MAAKAKLARDMSMLKFHFEKLLADIKTGETLAPADQESNDLFRDTMDQIDAVQGEISGAIPIDRQAEAMSLMEQTDDLRSRIVRLRSAERKKRGRKWIQPFPVLDQAEVGDGVSRRANQVSRAPREDPNRSDERQIQTSSV